jgi:transposase
VLRGKDVHELGEMKQMGLSVSDISEVTGYDRKTVRKYLLEPEGVPRYGPRTARPSRLDPYKPYLEDRMQAGVWNAQVLLRELRERGYGGGYTILKDWLHPQRVAAGIAAVRRFETPPGKQAQVDWGHLGDLEMDGEWRRIWGFAITLGYSRRMWAQAALDQKLGTLLRMHEAAFQEWGAVPEEILYDRMKTVWLGVDERSEIVWHPVFLDFARYWGFRPRLCRPYRAKTKGKIESGVKYIRRNFVCGLLGREPACLMDFNTELRQWVETVANRRVHGTTYEQVLVRWDMDQFAMRPLNGRGSYPYSDDELRKVARDAYVSWQASRYSVPWPYAGKEVWVRERGDQVEVHYGGERIATHAQAARKHQVITERSHHEGIPLDAGRAGGKILVHLREMAPAVETRPLAAYESLAMAVGGAQ